MTAQPGLEQRPVVGPLADAVGCVQDAVAGGVWRLSDGELGDVFALVDQARRDLERLLVAAATEADRRGTAASDGASSLTDWVAGRCPSMALGEVHQLVVVVTASRQPKAALLAQAVRSGVLPLRKAARLVRALDQVAPFIEVEDYTAAQRILLPLAAAGTDRDWRLALEHLVAVAAPERDGEMQAMAQARARDFSERASTGGITEFVWRLDPEGAAVVHAVTMSLAAKPCPDDAGPDPRSPGQRRCDALLGVLKRGMAAGDGVHTNGAATMLVRIDHAVLDGQVRGLGRTSTGEQLTVGALRRLACEADLLPAVYGSASQVLDLGRAARLATRAQHLALGIRDTGCTMPGCSMPAQFCIAHHVTWWSRGGRTDLGNLALLCGRHHGLVHDRDLRATIDPEGVTWHL